MMVIHLNEGRANEPQKKRGGIRKTEKWEIKHLLVDNNSMAT